MRSRSFFILFIVTALTVFVLFPACEKPQQESGPNSLSEAEKTAGWTLLFDGKSLDKWHGLGQASFPDEYWIIEGDAIKKLAQKDGPKMPDGQPKQGGDLITNEAFDNYEFSFEWKISEGGNSGIKYNVSEELSTSREPVHGALGWEYQVLDDENHSDNVNPTHRAGSLYDILPPTNKTLKSVGEWNQSRIVVNGTHGEHWLNGTKVVEYDTDTAEFDSLYQKSKYFKIEGFREKKTGHIVLQDHADAVWYRNLKIREL
ncbi:MAG: DUF1080 domain-containing protein [Calditrichaeota bacterium]|nr:MAG: DUF1080 domain-containing protein [Calditrichota bacterium]